MLELGLLNAIVIDEDEGRVTARVRFLAREVRGVGACVIIVKEVGDGVRLTGSRLPVGPESGRRDVLLVTRLARVGSLVRVQPFVQLEVDKLGELGRTEVTQVRLLTGVQSEVGLEVGGGGEALVADVTLVRLFTCVNQVVLLQVSQLREGLGTDVARERPLSRMRPQVHLQVRQLAKGLVADVALVVHLSVLLLERVGQGAVPATRGSR